MNSIIRQGERKDIPQLVKLAKSFPLCNLPENKTQLAEIIETSNLSFKKSISERYLFVLEYKGEIIGSSQILSCQTENYPYFSLHKKGSFPSLQLITNQKGQTQLGGLILHKKYRASSKKWGRQIGLFRFLYIAEHPEVFTKKIEVSLTAALEESNTNSLFWEYMGFPDLPKSYLNALALYKKDPSRFFSLFPKSKTIPLKDLMKKLKLPLEKVHPATLPVYKGLLKLGFKKVSRYHVLDGGLFLEGRKSSLPIIKQSRKVYLKQGQPGKENSYLWGQEAPDGFSGGLVKGEVKGNLLLLKTLPSYLINEKVRIIPFYPKASA